MLLHPKIYSASLLLALSLLAGCATTSTHRPATEAAAEVEPPAPAEMVLVAADNSPLIWDALVAQAAAADVIILGEQHDDLAGHRFQTALVTALLEQHPAAVCLEMFERNEQPLVDAYLADTIAQKTLVETTDSKDWGAKGRWDDFYQPTVDAAKAAKAPVIAANAPRRFTRLARLEGFEGLARFSEFYADQFVVPTPIAQQDYAERFKDTMRHHSAPPAPKKGTKKSVKSTESMGGMPPLSEEKLETFFQAQQVWDATMADSVLRAQAAHGKAILLIGQFHTDHQGGTLLRMKAAAPDLNYFTISVQKAESDTLREEDEGRADVVVYRPISK